MGKTLATMGSMPTLLLFLFLLESSSASHQLNGQAPNITSQPQDIMVSSDSFISAGSVMANLVLPCVVTRVPIPTVTWYRGDSPVDSGSVFDGTLAINVTEGGGTDATGAGVLYHCQATNMLNNFRAIVRSRDVNVTYTSFSGFIYMVERTVDVSVVVGGVAALECDVRVTVPLPTIGWFDSAETIFTDEQLLEGGRYLYIPEVTGDHINRTYHCQAGMNVAPTTYKLVGNLPADIIKEYKPIGNLIGRVGEKLSFSYIASSHGVSQDGNIREVSMNCVYNPGDEEISTRGLIGTFTVPEPTEGVGILNIRCTLFTPSAGTRVVNGTVAVFKPARITNPPHPPEGNNPLIDRERLVGGGSISYTCVGEGSPDLPLVTWYYNGGTVSLDGVTVNGNNLAIAAPQVRHSGIYQCFVSNTFNQEAYFDQRTWVLEVRQPMGPVVQPLPDSTTGAVPDRYEGVLLVGELNDPDVVVARVESDPCPTVQWRFNGNDIASGDIYMISDPCTDPNSASPYEFTLTIANLTSATSGRYSAVFTHFSGSDTLSNFLVTIPETVIVQELDLAFDGDTRPSCLISGSSATLTCMTTGYPRPDLPRPTIIFRKDNEEIVANTPGFERVYFDQIRINNVEMSDEGLYSCEASDGTTTFRPPTPLPPLTFCTLPMIVGSSSTPNPREGSELIIDCVVSGIPSPIVMWIKDGNAFSGEDSDDRIFISSSLEGDMSRARVRIKSAIIDDAGVYTCTASNDAGSASDMLRIQVNEGESDTFFSTTVIIAIAAGAAGIVLVIVLIILLMICVYLCTKRFKTGSTDFQPYNVDLPSKSDYTDGRGNVDADSNDGEQPEAFNPEYQSLPVLRPSEPPPYKATPGYQHGAPLDGDDLEMIKYPPDSESFVTGVSPYSRQQDNGYRPSPDDFLSEDAQFV